MSAQFGQTIVRYLQFQVAKFLGSLCLFYLIFQNLSVSSYAVYGVMQSFTMVCSLLVGLNIQASFQKLYSMTRLQRSVNLVVLFVLVATTSLFTICFWIFYRAGFYGYVFNEAAATPNILVAYIYMISFSLLGLLNPLLNAQRKTILYGISTTAPVFITIIGISLVGVLDLNLLLVLISISNLSVLLINLILNPKIFSLEAYASRHFRKILGYCVEYTWLSLPTLGSRFITDLLARSLLLSAKGGLAVAIITFSTSLFAIFRSVEQEFFRAVTPFFMKNSGFRQRQFALTKKIIAYQSFFTLLFFASSPLWIGILMHVFPTKPAEVFSPLVLVLMAVLTVISYNKNYYLSRVKKNVDLLKSFFRISIAINLSILAVIYCIEVSVIKILLIQIFFMACNLILVRNVAQQGGMA